MSKTGETATDLLLKFLVGVVNAELLERVLLEVLESIDILRKWKRQRRLNHHCACPRTHQDSDKVLDLALNGLVCQALVCDGDEPIEQARVDVLRDGVLNNVGLRRAQARYDLVRPGHDLLLDDPLLELTLVDPEQLGRERKTAILIVQ